MKKDSQLTFNQLSDKINQLKVTYHVAIIDVITNNSGDQVCH